MPTAIDRALAACIAAVERGYTVEQCLAAYPQYAREIEPILRLLERAKHTGQAAMDDEAFERGRRRVWRAARAAQHGGQVLPPISAAGSFRLGMRRRLAARQDPWGFSGAPYRGAARPPIGPVSYHVRPVAGAAMPQKPAPAPVAENPALPLPETSITAPPRRRPSQRRFLFGRVANAASAVAAVCLLVAAVWFAQTVNASLPGSPLYALKRSGEQLQASFMQDSHYHADWQLAQARRRLDELARLEQQGRLIPQAWLTQAQEQTSVALAAGLALPYDERIHFLDDWLLEWRLWEYTLAAGRPSVAAEMINDAVAQLEQALVAEDLVVLAAPPQTPQAAAIVPSATQTESAPGASAPEDEPAAPNAAALAPTSPAPNREPTPSPSTTHAPTAVQAAAPATHAPTGAPESQASAPQAPAPVAVAPAPAEEPPTESPPAPSGDGSGASPTATPPAPSAVAPSVAQQPQPSPSPTWTAVPPRVVGMVETPAREPSNVDQAGLDAQPARGGEGEATATPVAALIIGAPLIVAPTATQTVTPTVTTTVTATITATPEPGAEDETTPGPATPTLIPTYTPQPSPEPPATPAPTGAPDAPSTPETTPTATPAPPETPAPEETPAEAGDATETPGATPTSPLEENGAPTPTPTPTPENGAESTGPRGRNGAATDALDDADAALDDDSP